MTPRVGIVGYGAVGRQIGRLFPSAYVYDEPLGLGDRSTVSQCEFAFVAVPTPQGPNGQCDTSIVDDVFSWLESSVAIIRSTVPIGTTDRLTRHPSRKVVFQPEYGPGETPDHPYSDPRSVRWIILGGESAVTSRVADLFLDVFNSEIHICRTNARTAELVKYMENCFLATKLMFCNEFFDIATALDIDYQDLRELWLMDPRIGRSHTAVHPGHRGFGGACLPKDMAAMAWQARSVGVEPALLDTVIHTNRRLRDGGIHD